MKYDDSNWHKNMSGNILINVFNRKSTGIGNLSSVSGSHWFNPNFAFYDTQLRRGVAYFDI